MTVVISVELDKLIVAQRDYKFPPVDNSTVHNSLKRTHFSWCNLTCHLCCSLPKKQTRISGHFLQQVYLSMITYLKRQRNTGALLARLLPEQGSSVVCSQCKMKGLIELEFILVPALTVCYYLPPYGRNITTYLCMK